MDGWVATKEGALSVLIAEDDPAMCRLLRQAAEENAGACVVGEAADGARALSLFENLSPRVVFVDIDLPVMDGVTLAREIFDRSPWTYLVFITAHSQYRIGSL